MLPRVPTFLPTHMLTLYFPFVTTWALWCTYYHCASIILPFCHYLSTLMHLIPLCFHCTCSHFVNTVAIRHADAGAGCRFWLDPAPVHSGCCGRGSVRPESYFFLRLVLFPPSPKRVFILNRGDFTSGTPSVLFVARLLPLGVLSHALFLHHAFACVSPFFSARISFFVASSEFSRVELHRLHGPTLMQI